MLKSWTRRVLPLIGWVAAMSLGAADRAPKILCATFPIYQLTRHVAEGRAGASVELMLPAALGCPHDYALTPQDMMKLSQADILVINGLGLEEFLGAPVERANKTLKIVDSSAGIKDLLRYTDDDDEDGEHGHSGFNPHLFADPRMAAKLTLNIAEGLAKADPAGANGYRGNAKVYAAKLDRLADDFAILGKRLKNNRVIAQHGALDYLARDMGLEIVGVIEAHAGQGPSAAETLKLVRTIREKKVGAILTEPQYPDKIGKTLAKETGVPTAVFDPVAGGPENAPPTYYENVMRDNLKTLEKTLGTK